MNLIQYASKKERVHVEQIIREQPVLKDADNVTIKTISVRKSLGLTMDVFAPAAASDEPLPVLVDIHGGGLIAGRKEQNRNFCIRMAQNGYLVFAPDYRLVPETNIFGQISDVLEALTVIEDRASEFGGDVRNLFIVADSAGAFLASMAVTAMHNPAEMQPVISRLDRHIPHKVQTLRVGAMAFQSGMFYIYKGKVGLLADSYMEKDWRKKDYAAVIQPEFYSKLLPQCFLCSGKDDFLKKQTMQFNELLENDNRTHRYVFSNDKGADHAYAALHPETAWGEMANTEMLVFFYRCKR